MDWKQSLHFEQDGGYLVCVEVPDGDRLASEGAAAPQVGGAPSNRRGRKPARFTKTQIAILGYLAGETALRGGVSCTKQQLADRMGRNVKTIDHSVSKLRQEGLVEVETNYDERGAQLSNTYRVVFGALP